MSSNASGAARSKISVKFKHFLSGIAIFSSDAEATSAVNDYFSGLDKSYYSEGLKGNAGSRR